MDKRYQVFVSSTYIDLEEERSEIMQALLELDCMPSGMELFPAASEQQWSWIKKVIDESDYYLVIIAGRYGSISANTGISYTEMEYRYAIDIGKPVIAFLHEDPSSIASKKTEKSRSSQKRLEQFRGLCEQKLCKYWSSPADLGAKVSRSITQLMKHEPAVGWVRANEIVEDRSKEIIKLNEIIEKYKQQIDKLSTQKPHGIDKLSQENDLISLEYSYKTKLPKKGKNNITYWKNGSEYDSKIKISWNEIFAYLSPEIINPNSEYRVVSRINGLIKSEVINGLEEQHKGEKIEDIRIYSNVLDTIKIQFRALKLIDIDEEDYWYLTPYGDTKMNQLVAVIKS